MNTREASGGGMTVTNHYEDASHAEDIPKWSLTLRSRARSLLLGDMAGLGMKNADAQESESARPRRFGTWYILNEHIIAKARFEQDLISKQRLGLLIQPVVAAILISC
jgi:hypothetical protein